MSHHQFRTGTATTLALLSLVLAPVPFARAEDPVTEVCVLEDPGHGFTILGDVSGGVLKAWIAADDGTVVLFARETDETLPWQLQTASQQQADIATFAATELSTPLGKTCCEWQCDDGNHFSFSIITKNCTDFGRGCQRCWLTCSEGWINCPAGTTKYVDLRPH